MFCYLYCMNCFAWTLGTGLDTTTWTALDRWIAYWICLVFGLNEDQRNAGPIRMERVKAQSWTGYVFYQPMAACIDDLAIHVKKHK